MAHNHGNDADDLGLHKKLASREQELCLPYSSKSKERRKGIYPGKNSYHSPVAVQLHIHIGSYLMCLCISPDKFCL